MESGQSAVENLVDLSNGSLRLAQWEMQLRHRRVDFSGFGVSPGLQRIGRFGVAGLGSTVLYFLLANLLVVAVGLAPVTASACSYFVALVLSYALQSIFAFRVTTHSVERMSRFAATAGLGLLISYGVMWLATDILQLEFVYGAIAVCIIIPIVNFIFFSRWVFASG